MESKFPHLQTTMLTDILAYQTKKLLIQRFLYIGYNSFKNSYWALYHAKHVRGFGIQQASLRGTAQTVRKADEITHQQWHIYGNYRNIKVIFFPPQHMCSANQALSITKMYSLLFACAGVCVCVWSWPVSDASSADSRSIHLLFKCRWCQASPSVCWSCRLLPAPWTAPPATERWIKWFQQVKKYKKGFSYGFLILLISVFKWKPECKRPL